MQWISFLVSVHGLYNETMHLASAYGISISTNNEGWCVLVGGHSVFLLL